MAARCAGVSQRRNSKEAAVLSAGLYLNLDQPEKARAVLLPFEATDDAWVLLMLGYAETRLGKHADALKAFQRAYDAAGRTANVGLRVQAATQLAYALVADGDFEKAVRMLDEVLHAPEGSIQLLFERDARLELARALNQMGDAPAAEAELQRLRGILGARPLTTIELLLDARLHVENGQLRSADGLLEEAQKTAHEAGILRSLEASAVMNRIEIAVKEADWGRVQALSKETRTFQDVLQPDDWRDLAWLEGIAARAEGHYAESLKLLEQARALSPPPNELWEIDDDLGRTLQALGRKADARKAFEESISEVESQRKQLVDPGLQAALYGSRQKPYDALFELVAESGDAESALGTLRRSLASRLDDAVAQPSSSAGHEVSDALQRSAAARTLAEASRALPDREDGLEDTRYVAFVTTDSHSWALVHAAGQASVERVALAPVDLCSLMQRFGEDPDDETAGRLGSALFSPSTLARLGGRFAIILPACVRSFPVEAVRIGNGRLVDRAVVSIAPDVSTVQRSASQAAFGLASSSLVLADPLGDLPAAREEGTLAGQLTQATLRVGPSASVQALEHFDGRLLHFATHTVVDVAGPALVLSDKSLSVADILRRRLHADLVVLASCHSGSRLEASAAETLSTAFLRAGSGAVLATLRSVEDGFAYKVVRAFYEQGGVEDPAGALARVQRSLSRTEPPARWAAFFVAGSPDAAPRAGAPLRGERSGAGR